MDKFSDRKKALILSALGALGITLFIYGTGLFITYVLDQADVATTAIVENTPELTEKPSDILVVTETFSESVPYGFEITTYVFKGGTVKADEYNRSIQNFVSNVRDDFENDLLFFNDSINSPESNLKITALEIVENSNQIQINYEIEKFLVGDSTAVVSNQSVVLN